MGDSISSEVKSDSDNRFLNLRAMPLLFVTCFFMAEIAERIFRLMQLFYDRCQKKEGMLVYRY